MVEKESLLVQTERDRAKRTKLEEGLVGWLVCLLCKILAPTLLHPWMVTKLQELSSQESKT